MYRTKKYKNVKSWPINTYNPITGKPPIQLTRKHVIKKKLIKKTCTGLKLELLILEFFKRKGKKNKDKINQAIIKIPNNLSVTDRKTAYKGKKYHSGTIWDGVDKKFANI